MNAECAGKTVRSLENACLTWAPWRCYYDKALYKSTFTFTIPYCCCSTTLTNCCIVAGARHSSRGCGMSVWGRWVQRHRFHLVPHRCHFSMCLYMSCHNFTSQSHVCHSAHLLIALCITQSNYITVHKNNVSAPVFPSPIYHRLN